MDEEAIYAALALLMAKVTWTIPGEDPVVTYQFKDTSRRIRLFSDVPSAEQPWCGQAEHGSTEDQKTGLPYKTVLEAQWIIYQCDAQNPNAIPTITNNQIIKGVREALRPIPRDPGFQDRRNTLGGLVHHCFIQGRTLRDPGDIDGQGMIVIPIKLLVP